MKLPDALPPLRGRTGGILRGAFLALLALTAAMLAAGSWMTARDFFSTVPNNLQFGFMTGTGTAHFPDHKVRIYAVTSDRARRSGLRVDDLILSVNGRPVPAAATELQVGDMMGAIKGDAATLVTRSSDGAVRAHVLTRQRDAWSAPIAGTGLTGWQRSLLLFAAIELNLLVLLAAAILLYRRRPNDPLALLFAFCFLFYCQGSQPSLWFWSSLGAPLVARFMPFPVYPLLLVGLNAFPDARLGSRWRRANAFVGVPAYLLLYLVLAFWIPHAARPTIHILARLPIYMLVGLLLSSAAALILRYRRLPLGLERQQIKWAVMGFAGFVLLFGARWVPPLLGFSIYSDRSFISFISAVLLGTVSALVLPLGLLVSLLKYRLYDADAAISRSASYSLLTLLLVLGFSIAKNGVDFVAEKAFDGTMVGAMSSGLAAAAVALLITPLHHRVLKWSEGKFQRPLVRLRSELPELLGDLRETAGLREVAATILDYVETGVRASRSAIKLGDVAIAARGEPHGESGSASQEAAYPVEVPLSDITGATVGTMLLGLRPDGSDYGHAERRALEQVATPAARALRIASEREQAATAQAAAMERLSQAVATLQARLDRLEPPAVAAE